MENHKPIVNIMDNWCEVESGWAQNCRFAGELKDYLK
jgi:hypothetical protein